MSSTDPAPLDISAGRFAPMMHRWTLRQAALLMLFSYALVAAAVWMSRRPDAATEELIMLAAILIFAATYIMMAVGGLPGFYLDRAGAALLGASLMVAAGLLSLDDAYRAIDVDTIALLLGMMIVVANVRLSGFFRLVNNWAVTRAGHPLALLAV